MRAHLVMTCENVAFGETREDVSYEVSVIFSMIAVALRENPDYGRTYETLRDTNGNDVGQFCLKGEDDPGYADLLLRPSGERRRWRS